MLKGKIFAKIAKSPYKLIIEGKEWLENRIRNKQKVDKLDVILLQTSSVMNFQSRVIGILYQRSIDIVARLLPIAAHFFPKINAYWRGQDSINLSKIREIRVKFDQLVWMHSASLGEFEQGRPVLEALKRAYPHIGIFASFFSPSGYENRKSFPLLDGASYLPIDVSEHTQSFVEAVDPTLVVFVKYDFWPNMISAIKNRGIPLFGISLRLDSSFIYFKSYGERFRESMRAFDFLFLQDKNSLELLRKIGIERAQVVGDTRYDRVLEGKKEEFLLPSVLEKALKNRRVWVAGSVWPTDMDVLIPFIERRSDWFFIIAPHDIHAEEIREYQKKLSRKSIKWSSLSDENEDFDTVFVDNVGILSRLYRLADAAYVGGAFGKGLHNILEPAVYGIPLFFGNKTLKKFPEASEMIEYGFAFSVADAQDLENKHLELNWDKKRALEYVEAQRGATGEIIKKLDSWIL